MIMKRSLLTFIAIVAMTMTASAQKLNATFGSLPGGANASLGLYTWTATTNNLLPLFEFSNGELANYTTLKFTLSNKSADSGMLRIGYYIDGSFKEFTNADGNSGFGSSGDKSIDLTTQGVDLSKVTKIAFGGKTGTGSVNISPAQVYLVPTTGDYLFASIGTLPGGANATYYDYTWTATTNNLWPLFEFANGELANYITLHFSLSDKTADSGMLRIGYYIDGVFTEFVNADGNSGFGSNGEKSIDLTAQGINLGKVTKIAFGGKTGTGSVNIRDVYVQGASTGISKLNASVTGKKIYYNMNGQQIAQPSRGLYIVNGKKTIIR